MHTRLPAAGLFCIAFVVATTTAGADPPGVSTSGLPQIEYVFESISLQGNEKTGERFFVQFLDLEPGSRVSVEQLDDYRRTLFATGFFTSVDARLSPGRSPNGVVVDISVEERNSLRVTDTHLGISRDTPIWGGLELAETNLLGTGITLSAGFVLSAEQGAGRLGVADPFGAAGIPFGWSLEGYLLDGTGTGPASDGPSALNEVAFGYLRGGGRIGFGFDYLSPLTAHLSFRAEIVEQRQIDRADHGSDTGLPPEPDLLTSLGATFGIDLRPPEERLGAGFRAQVTADLSATALGSRYDFLRLLGNVSYGLTLNPQQLLEFQVTGGYLTNPEQAPFFEGFYVGDTSPLVASRDIGLQFTDRRSLDLLDTGADLVTYGDLYIHPRLEWSVSLTTSEPGSGGVALFLGAGLVTMRDGPWEVGRPDARLSPQTTESGGLRPDLTFDAGVRADTAFGRFEFSLGSLMSLLPLN